MAEDRQPASLEAIAAQVPDGAEGAPSAPGRKGKGGLSRARRICILVVFLSIVAGLLLRAGWGTLCSLGFETVFLACPIGALETLVAGHAIVPRLLVVLAVTVVLVALFGRTFCAWGCVVPPISRFFHPNGAKRAARKGKPAQGAEAEGQPCERGDSDEASGASEALKALDGALAEEPSALSAPAAARGCTSCAACGGAEGCALPPIGGKRDGLQLDTRHGVLVGALVSSAICGFPVFCLVCPIGLSIALVVGIYSAIFEQNPTVSLLVFAGIILIELAFFRKWCHKLCPVGAFMSLVGLKAPIGKPRVDEAKCLRAKGADCRVCVEVCPEQLDPHSRSIPECTRCGRCVEQCPARAIGMKKTPKRPAA